MTDYIKIATEASDQYLAALAATQEQFLKYVKTFATWTPTGAPQSLALFGQGSLPSAKDVSTANFAFAEKLLNQQQSFTEKLFASKMPA